jgi:hypothetical protein
VIVPAIRGGAAVMGSVFDKHASVADDADERPGKTAST